MSEQEFKPYRIVEDYSNFDAWIEARRGLITASDVPAILGQSRFGSPLSVAADKLIDGVKVEETEQMRWGKILEPIICEETAKGIGMVCKPFGKLIVSTKYPWLGATPDAFCFERSDADFFEGIPLEVKATAMADRWHEGMPTDVSLQHQTQLAVTGCKRGFVAVLLTGNRLRWAEVKRDDLLIDNVILPETEVFWNKIQKGERIDADASEATRLALKALYPKDSGETIPLPGTFIPLDEERTGLKNRIEEDARRCKYIENQIRSELGEATFGTMANGVTYSLRTSKSGVRTLRRTEKK